MKNNPPFPAHFYEHLTQHTLTGIKGGTQRNSFLEIWVVCVGQRVFARSWSQSPRSWFTALQEEQVGQLQYGQHIVNITGLICNDPATNILIDNAYRNRYTTPENIPYVEGITQPAYINYTMELFFINESTN